MNERKKLKIVRINREKRQKSKNFMKKNEQRWDIEFLQKGKNDAKLS